MDLQSNFFLTNPQPEPNNMKNQSKLPSAEVITRDSFPGSKKIYVKGKIHPVKVAMREIETDDEVMFAKEITSGGNGSGKREKRKITVYDTSGPYPDPDVEINVHEGLLPLRSDWIRSRGDVEVLAGFSSSYANERLNDPKLHGIHFKNMRHPFKAKAGRNV